LLRRQVGFKGVPSHGAPGILAYKNAFLHVFLKRHIEHGDLDKPL